MKKILWMIVGHSVACCAVLGQVIQPGGGGDVELTAELIAAAGGVTNGQSGVTLGLASGTYVANATASNQPVSFFQLEQALVGNVEGFLTGDKTLAFTNYFEPTNFTYLVSSTNWQAAATLSIPTTTNGGYVLAGISTGQTFTALQDGTAKMELWISENEAGSASVKPELYLYDTVRNALVEFGNGGGSQAVPIGATPQQLLFTVPYPMITTNNPCYLVARLKVTGLTLTPTLIVGYGNGYVTHFEISVPGSGMYAPLSHVGQTGNAAHSGMVTNGQVIAEATNANLATWAGSATNANLATWAKSSTNAQWAMNATNAQLATWAGSATNANLATWAKSSTNAQWAMNATNAQLATWAGSATNANYATVSATASNLVGSQSNALAMAVTTNLTEYLGAPFEWTNLVVNTSNLTLGPVWAVTNTYYYRIANTGAVTLAPSGWPSGRYAEMVVSLSCASNVNFILPTNAPRFANGTWTYAAPSIRTNALLFFVHSPHEYWYMAGTNDAPIGTP